MKVIELEDEENASVTEARRQNDECMIGQDDEALSRMFAYQSKSLSMIAKPN